MTDVWDDFFNLWDSMPEAELPGDKRSDDQTNGTVQLEDLSPREPDVRGTSDQSVHDVGRLEHYPWPGWVKEFRPHQLQAVDDVLAAFERVDVVILDAPVGCLSGDTKIGINRGGKGSQIPLKDLVHKFNGGTYIFGRSGGSEGVWRTDISTKIQTNLDGVMRLGTIKRAYSSGIKTTYQVEDSEGRIIKSTKDHRFDTREGWKTLECLRVGDEVKVLTGQGGTERRKKPSYLQREGLKFHPRHHAEEGAWRHVMHRIGFSSIISITELGREETFDIEIEEEQHNFIANGFVVHNSGKTLIAEMVRVALGKRGVYICSGKQLQDQFAGDFGYSRILKGRGNYPTESFPYPDYSAADCNKTPGDKYSCLYCSTTENCPYEQAKRKALASEVAVLNTTYLLYEANHVGRFSKQKFVVVDECDVVEGELMKFVEFRITGKKLREIGLDAPKKGVHKQTLQAWIDGDLQEAVDGECKRLGDETAAGDVRAGKDLKHWGQVQGRIKRGLSAEIEGDNWIREYEESDGGKFEGANTGAFILKPVNVSEYGQRSLWQHSTKWLLMSGTVCAGEVLAGDLGITDGGYEVVNVPMMFGKETRPVVVVGVADMTWKKEEVEREKLLKGIEKVLEMHEGENVLVHTNSYRLTKWLYGELKDGAYGKDGRIKTYLQGKDREKVLATFRREGGVLLAPSADRGVDLPDDLCRVCVIAKIPFPSLGDKQTSARLHTRGGQTWYSVKTIRQIVQMAGRGVRHEGDYCVTYVLDKQFGKVFRMGKWMFPRYFIEGVEYGANSEMAKEMRKVMR